MNIPDRLKNIRQHLQQAKQLSGEARGSFKQVESGSENAGSLLSTVSQDLFQAGLVDRRGALVGAAQRAEESLVEVQEHHETVVDGYGALTEIDPVLQDSLYAAKMEADALGVPSNETWFLRNAIDSAQRESGYANQSLKEIDKSLFGIEGELNGVMENATELGTVPAWRNNRPRHGHGGWRDNNDNCAPTGDNRWRGRRYHSGGGQRWREKMAARILERRNRGRAIDEAAGKLDNPFAEMDTSADRGARHQLEVGNYVDQALRYVDELEMKLSAANQPKPQPRFQPQPISFTPSPVIPQPVAVESPTAPLPVWDTPLAPQPAPAPAPAPEQKRRGFFKKPWKTS